MKKRIIAVLAMIALAIPGMIFAEDAIQGEGMLPAPANTGSQNSSVSYPREWYIMEQIPDNEGLTIGVWRFEQGMPIEHIRSVFGKPQEIISLEMEEGFIGNIRKWSAIPPAPSFLFNLLSISFASLT